MLTVANRRYTIHDASNALVAEGGPFETHDQAQRAGERAHREYIATLGVSLAAHFMTDDQIAKELGI